MSKYRKKPVVIEAFQMTPDRRMDNSEWPAWLGEAWNGERDAEGTLQRVDMNAALPDMLEVVTLEGKHLVTWGDYIIRGVKGELYPCKPDIFSATYEPAALPAAPTFTAADLERAWQPIETAPRDGTPILAMVVIDGILLARTAVWISTETSKYNPDGGFWTCPNLKAIIGEFTHWMPLPEPPADLAQRVKEDRT